MTDPPEVAAFWKAIGARPDDQLPRLVFADWLEEREESSVVCDHCGNGAKLPPKLEWETGSLTCTPCRGTGYVGNGYAELAAALRATAANVPYYNKFDEDHSWFFISRQIYLDVPHPQSDVSREVFNHLHSGHYENSGDGVEWHEYLTAESAIRDLCAAWVKLNHQGASG